MTKKDWLKYHTVPPSWHSFPCVQSDHPCINPTQRKQTAPDDKWNWSLAIMRFGPAEIWRISPRQKTYLNYQHGFINLGKLFCFVCLPWVRTGHVLTCFTCARCVFATLHVHLWEPVGSAGVALIPTQIQALSLALKIFKTGEDSLRNEIRGIFPLQSIITPGDPATLHFLLLLIDEKAYLG